MSKISSFFRFTLVGALVGCGAINTISLKFQNKQLVQEGPFLKYFFHPYMQAATMFLGMFLAFFLNLIFEKLNPDSCQEKAKAALLEGKKQLKNKFLFAIPSICDLTTSTMEFVALNFVAGSVHQIMRGGQIISTLIFSIIFLKMKAKKREITGSFLAFVGVAIVGCSNLIYSAETSSDSDLFRQIIGYLLMMSSLFLNGFHYVYEEKLLSQYHIEPMEMVGYEGMFGLSIIVIVIAIISHVPCGFGLSACVYDTQGMPFMEIPSMFFHELGRNGYLMFFSIVEIISICAVNIAGVSITKYINALARSICDACRTIIVWIVGIFVTISMGTQHPSSNWQLLSWRGALIQLSGFLILIFGNLVYNQLVIVPFTQQLQQLQKPLLDIEMLQIKTVDHSQTDM